MRMMNTLSLSIGLAGLLSVTGAIAKDVSADELAALVKAGKVLPKEKLEAAALARHPGGSIEEGAEVELHHRGYIYEVEVTDAKGTEWDMEIDAATGKVVRDDED